MPEETSPADEAGDFIDGVHGQKEGREGNLGELLAMWLIVLGFMVMGLVSRLSLANHSEGCHLQIQTQRPQEKPNLPAPGS